jgi:hypothetical protein
MDDFQGVEEKAFMVDEVNSILQESIELTVQNNAYHHNKVGQWNSNSRFHLTVVVEQALKKLTGLNKPFKYIVTCVYILNNDRQSCRRMAPDCTAPVAATGIQLAMEAPLINMIAKQ